MPSCDLVNPSSSSALTILTPCASQITPCASQMTPRASRITPCASRITPCASRITPRASRITPRASRITPRASRMTPHASRITPRSCRITPCASRMTPCASRMTPRASVTTSRNRPFADHGLLTAAECDDLLRPTILVGDSKGWFDGTSTLLSGSGISGCTRWRGRRRASRSFFPLRRCGRSRRWKLRKWGL